LQGWVNNNADFTSLCTRLVALPDGIGALYKRLVSCRYGPKYINNEKFREQLASCHAHNSELTAALIENEEGAQVILETCNGIPDSTFEAIENDIRGRSAAVASIGAGGGSRGGGGGRASRRELCQGTSRAGDAGRILEAHHAVVDGDQQRARLRAVRGRLRGKRRKQRRQRVDALLRRRRFVGLRRVLPERRVRV
jgi:hypothetical protein